MGGAFTAARDSMQLAFPEQHAQLEVNENGVPNEMGASGDEEQAATLYIGRGTVIIGDAPVIGGVSPAQNLNNSATAMLYADSVTDVDGIARVWAVLRPPGYAALSSDNPVQELPAVELVLHATTADRWEASYGRIYPARHLRCCHLCPGQQPQHLCPACDLGDGRESTGTPCCHRGGWQSCRCGMAGARAGRYRSLSGIEGAGLRKCRDQIFQCNHSRWCGSAPSIQFLEDTLTNWAGSDTQDVTLYLVGESDGTDFLLSDSEVLPAAQLDSWLDTLQTSLPGKLTVVMDADNAGFYLARLTTPTGLEEDRFRLASTIAGSAHLEDDGSVSWSQYFWGNVANGARLPIAHLLAKRAMQAAASHQQQAWLDSDSDDTSDKYDISRILHYSLGPGILLAGDDPVIGSAGIDEINLNGDPMQLTLWTQDITTTGMIDQVWALVTPPDVDGFGGTDPVPEKVLLLDTGPRYEAAYSLAGPLGGSYTVSFYAKDTDGAVSIPLSQTATRQDAYEIDDSEGQANTLVVDDPFQYHSFHTTNDEDWVTFTAVEDKTYTITADPVGEEADVVLQVKDPNGVITTIDDVPAGEHPLGAEVYIIPVDASNDGLFHVKVALDTGVANTPSDYTLAVTTDGGGSGTTSVAGQVRAPNGNPVDFATVKIEHTVTSATKSTLSFPSGARTHSVMARVRMTSRRRRTVTCWRMPVRSPSPEQGTTIRNITLHRMVPWTRTVTVFPMPVIPHRTIRTRTMTGSVTDQIR